MRYMAISLSFLVFGLMLNYLFYKVNFQPGKTLNAVFFQQATSLWGFKISYAFIFIALMSEATLLFVAAQTGFIDGPRVLSNMAVDRWFPTRFSMLSDRLVIQNGILIMSALALLLMAFTGGSVRFLVVLYSINVFITFSLSQLGMVRHWWISRFEVKKWRRKLLVNGVGLVLTASILVSMVLFKFQEGGWITLLITGALVGLAILIKRHYLGVAKMMHRLNDLVISAEEPVHMEAAKIPSFDAHAKTAVILVNGFNGMGLHTLFGVIRLFAGVFKNFVFIQVGVVDAGNFKGHQEMERLHAHVHNDLSRYVKFMEKQGYYAQGISAIGVDVVEEAMKLSADILKKFPGAVFFGGQLVFPKDSFLLRFLHNYTVFALQKRLYREGALFVILPIRV
jgi:hypothetical protein